MSSLQELGSGQRHEQEDQAREEHHGWHQKGLVTINQDFFEGITINNQDFLEGFLMGNHHLKMRLNNISNGILWDVTIIPRGISYMDFIGGLSGLSPSDLLFIAGKFLSK